MSIHGSEVDVMDISIIPPKLVQFLFHKDSAKFIFFKLPHSFMRIEASVWFLADGIYFAMVYLSLCIIEDTSRQLAEAGYNFLTGG